MPWPTRTDAAILVPVPVAPTTVAGAPAPAMPQQPARDSAADASVVATRPAMTVIAQETHFAPVATPALRHARPRPLRR